MLNEPEIPHLLTDRQQGLKVMKKWKSRSSYITNKKDIGRKACSVEMHWVLPLHSTVSKCHINVSQERREGREGKEFISPTSLDKT